MRLRFFYLAVPVVVYPDIQNEPVECVMQRAYVCAGYLFPVLVYAFPVLLPVLQAVRYFGRALAR
jgi:hypothetical protein